MPSAVAGSNCGHIYMPSAPRELKGYEYCLAGYIFCAAVVITLGNLYSLIPKLLLPCAYDTMTM